MSWSAMFEKCLIEFSIMLETQVKCWLYASSELSDQFTGKLDSGEGFNELACIDAGISTNITQKTILQRSVSRFG